MFKLSINGQCVYDEFEKAVEKENYLRSELKTIETRFHEISECKLLPETKFRDLTPRHDNHKEYELKTRHLRVYLFHDKMGHIIVTGGKKGTQKADIKILRQIKKEYFKS